MLVRGSRREWLCRTTKFLRHCGQLLSGSEAPESWGSQGQRMLGDVRKCNHVSSQLVQVARSDEWVVDLDFLVHGLPGLPVRFPRSWPFWAQALYVILKDGIFGGAVLFGACPAPLGWAPARARAVDDDDLGPPPRSMADLVARSRRARAQSRAWCPRARRDQTFSCRCRVA